MLQSVCSVPPIRKWRLNPFLYLHFSSSFNLPLYRSRIWTFFPFLPLLPLHSSHFRWLLSEMGSISPRKAHIPLGNPTSLFFPSSPRFLASSLPIVSRRAAKLRCEFEVKGNGALSGDTDPRVIDRVKSLAVSILSTPIPKPNTWKRLCRVYWLNFVASPPTFLYEFIINDEIGISFCWSWLLLGWNCIIYVNKYAHIAWFPLDVKVFVLVFAVNADLIVDVGDDIASRRIALHKGTIFFLGNIVENQTCETYCAMLRFRFFVLLLTLAAILAQRDKFEWWIKNVT